MNQFLDLPGKTYFLLIIVILLLSIFFKTSRTKPQRRDSAYQPVPLMTANEIEFFNRLSRSLPGVHVFPQVAMAALIAPVDSFQQNRYAYWKINEKRVDYAIYDRSMALICIIELDDRMHNPEKDKARDRLTRSAGVTTLRWQSRAKPSELEIFQAVNQLPHMLDKPLLPLERKPRPPARSVASRPHSDSQHRRHDTPAPANELHG